MRRPEGPEWFGVYLAGKKGGWTRAERTQEVREGKPVIVARTETGFRVNAGGQTVDRRLLDVRVYEARPSGRLLAFRAEFEGDGGTRTLDGTCDPAACRAVIVTPEGRRDERTIPPVGEVAEMADAVRLAAARRTALRGPMLELDKLRVRDMEVKFARRETVAAAGVEAEVSVVTEGEVGDRQLTEYRVADDGRIVEVRLGDAMLLRPEPEAVARSVEKVDLFSLTRVELPRELPRDVPATIRYRISGMPEAFHRDDARQGFARGPGGETILTVTARRPAAADPRRDTPLPKARQGAAPEDLAATPLIESDHLAISELARTVAGDAPGAYAAAVKLADHVFRRLQKAYGASNDRASEVLAAGKGDCTEHTVLFLALARSLGIPARGVFGLVYSRYEDGVNALYWHAWAEVRAGGEWIPLDPTFGQPVADATHVALGGGERPDGVGLLGGLRVLSVEVLAPKGAAKP